MRLAALADIHGNRKAFAAVLAAVPADVTQMLFVGDLCGYYAFVNECADLWDEARFIGVRGNHDQVLLECLRTGSSPAADYTRRYGTALQRSLEVLSERARNILRSLPEQRRESIAGARIAMFHGAPWDPLEGRVYPDFQDWPRFDEIDADVVLLGHTHYPMVVQRAGLLIVNPGSVGQARDGSGACFALVDVERREATLHRVPFDSGEVIDDARRCDPDLPYLVRVMQRP
jgi:putative phosphoesterase